MSEPATTRHDLFDDVQAMLSGTIFVALGATLYAHAGLLTGGTVGAAILFSYWTGWGFGPLFFLLNLPFIALAMLRMGRSFVIRTFCAVGMVSLLAEWTPHLIRFELLQPAYAAVIGGFLMGAGLLMLFRHRASLGGVNILALYLQERHGFSAGKVQLVIDCSIVIAGFFTVDLLHLALSIAGAAVVNMVLAVNHKPGRYRGVS